MIGGCPLRMLMQSRSRNLSLIRRLGGNPALKEWQMRRSVSRRGVAVGGAHRMFRTADAGLQKLCNFRLLRGVYLSKYHTNVVKK